MVIEKNSIEFELRSLESPSPLDYLTLHLTIGPPAMDHRMLLRRKAVLDSQGSWGKSSFLLIFILLDSLAHLSSLHSYNRCSQKLQGTTHLIRLQSVKGQQRWQL